MLYLNVFNKNLSLGKKKKKEQLLIASCLTFMGINIATDKILFGWQSTSAMKLNPLNTDYCNPCNVLTLLLRILLSFSFYNLAPPKCVNNSSQ